MNTLLVPLDGSPLAAQALPFAEALAGATSSALVLVQSVKEDDAEVDEQSAGESLAAVARELEGRGLTVSTDVRQGDPAAAIAEAARATNALLIVMATHARTIVGRWLHGSVAEEVLRTTTTPILMLQDDVPAESAATLTQQPRLLVPLDGSDFAEAALPTAEWLAGALGGSISVLRAVPMAPLAMAGELPAAPVAIEQLDEEVDDAREYVAEVKERYGANQQPIAGESEVGDPATVIVEAAKEQGVAMIVMATHMPTGADRLFLGSVADSVVRRSPVPVLLLRPNQEEEPAELAVGPVVVPA